jgi:hypothetical protein
MLDRALTSHPRIAPYVMVAAAGSSIQTVVLTVEHVCDLWCIALLTTAGVVRQVRDGAAATRPSESYCVVTRTPSLAHWQVLDVRVGGELGVRARGLPRRSSCSTIMMIRSVAVVW